MNTRNVISVALLSAALSQSALAGGLFGDGGLIRGDVGNFLDKHVEKPITTPIAKGIEEHQCETLKAASIAACVKNGGDPIICAGLAEKAFDC